MPTSELSSPPLWLRETWPPALKLESLQVARSTKTKSREDWNGFDLSDSISIIEVHQRKGESAEKGIQTE